MAGGRQLILDLFRQVTLDLILFRSPRRLRLIALDAQTIEVFIVRVNSLDLTPSDLRSMIGIDEVHIVLGERRHGVTQRCLLRNPHRTHLQNLCQCVRDVLSSSPRKGGEGAGEGKKFFLVRVLHVTNSIMAGGAELHLLALCRRLAARDVRQTVVYLHDRPVTRNLRAEFEEAGIATRRVPANGRYNVAFPFAVASVVGALRPDLVHTHLPRADLAGGFVKLRRPSLPWVVSMHNIYTADSWSAAGLLPFLDLVWRRADGVIAISQAVADWLVRARRVSADRVRVIHYGIEPEPFLAPHPDARTRWGLPDGPLVTAIGRLTPHKGFATLITAWRTVRDRMPNAMLVIAGWDVGGYRQELQSLVEALHLPAAVRLVGFVDDVPAFLAAGDVFALPSTSEGFGQVVIEAMAAARPVVVSRIPPLTEIVADGDTGLLVPPEDADALAAAILSLLETPCHAGEMGARARARVLAEFSAARMAEQTLAIYQRLVSEYGRPAPEAVDAG